MKEEYPTLTSVEAVETVEELLQDAHLFYNDENVPYTKESILTAETINEYLVNDLRVTCEEYNQFRNKYEEIEILQ